MLGKSSRSKGDIRVRIFLLTHIALYTKANSLCALVMCILTNNIAVLIIDHQAH